jgi:hypothetical protein
MEKAKVVCVMRNPRDVVVSLFHHWKIVNNYTVYTVGASIKQ